MSVGRILRGLEPAGEGLARLAELRQLAAVVRVGGISGPLPIVPLPIATAPAAVLAMERSLRTLAQYGWERPTAVLSASLVKRLAGAAAVTGTHIEPGESLHLERRLMGLTPDSLEFLDNTPMATGPLDLLFFATRLHLLPAALVLRLQGRFNLLRRERAREEAVASAVESLTVAHQRVFRFPLGFPLEFPLASEALAGRLSVEPHAVVGMFGVLPLWPEGELRIAERLGLIELP